MHLRQGPKTQIILVTLILELNATLKFCVTIMQTHIAEITRYILGLSPRNLFLVAILFFSTILMKFALYHY